MGNQGLQRLLTEAGPGAAAERASDAAHHRYLRPLADGVGVWPRLEIGSPSDPLEAEAERTAEEVLSHAATCSCGATCPTCRAAAGVQRTGEAGAAARTPARVSGSLLGGLGAGRSLDRPVRRFFEPRFGRDFGDVRVHDGPAAADAARSIGARAFTAGRDVVFGEGRYAPATSAGRKLVAHELAHVAQQAGSGSTQVLRQPDATAMTVSATWAQALSDDELDRQIRLVREQIDSGSLPAGDPVLETARSNLLVLHRGVLAAMRRDPGASKQRAPQQADGHAGSHAHDRVEVSDPNDPAELEAERIGQEVARLSAGAAGEACPSCQARAQRSETHLAASPAAPIQATWGNQRVLASLRSDVKRAPKMGSSDACPACEEIEEPEERVSAKSVHRTCSVCEQVEEQPSRAVKVNASPARESRSRGLSPRLDRPPAGRQLPSDLSAEMESYFDADFSSVRLHDSPQARADAERLGAKAFTYGHDIYLGGDASTHDTELMAHELTHVVQHGKALRAPVHRRGDGEAEEGALDAESEGLGAFFSELFQEIEEIEATGECGNLAYALRVRLLIASGGFPHPTDPDSEAAYREWVYSTAASEDETLDILPAGTADVFPSAFPETWADWVYEALATDESVPLTLFEAVMERYVELYVLQGALPGGIWDQGLPLTFEQARAGRTFRLSPAHARSEEEGAIKEFARAGVQYTRSVWQLSFIWSWNHVAQEVADAVRECDTTVSVPDYYDFLENYATILAALPERLSEAWDSDELQDVESGALSLADAALVAGFAAGLSALMGIMAGWSNASEMFDASLAEADAIVAGASNLGRFIAAVQWAERHDYFGAAGQEILQALYEHGWEIIGLAAAVIVAQPVPILNVAVDVVLFIVSGVDILATIDNLATAIQGVFDAQSVGGLQQASTVLATSLLADGIGALIDVALFMVSLKAARRQARDIRRLHPELSEEEAIRRALGQAEDATSRQLHRAADFDAWERSLNRETREALAADPALRAVFAQASARVRRLLTVCRSPCIPTRPRPSAQALAKIDRLMERLSLADDNPQLREYLYANRHRLDDAVDAFDDINSPARLRDLYDQDIRRHAIELGGTATRDAEGRWVYRRNGSGTPIIEYEQGSYRHLSDNRASDDFFQGHHGIQDRWAEQVGIPGYSQRDAPALLLRDRRAGTPHQRVSARQTGRRSGRASRTYADERALMRQDLNAADVPDHVIADHLWAQDEYFGRLYRNAEGTASRADLQRWFGDWTP